MRGLTLVSAGSQDVPVLELFVDETGSVTSDTENKPYGYGYFVVPRGRVADDLRERVRKHFPKVFHLKEQRQRKVTNATRLLALLPKHPFVFGGAHVIADSAYARKHYHDVVLNDLGGDSLIDLAKAAPLGQSGLVESAASILRPAYKGLRLYTIWNWVLSGAPILAIMNAPDCPAAIEIKVHLGVAGDHAEFERHLAWFGRSYDSKTITELQRRGDVPRIGCQIAVEPTGATDPLFGYADLFAGIGYRLHEGTDVGRELYEISKEYLDRVPWKPPKGVLRPGITVFPPP